MGRREVITVGRCSLIYLQPGVVTSALHDRQCIQIAEDAENGAERKQELKKLGVTSNQDAEININRSQFPCSHFLSFIDYSVCLRRRSSAPLSVHLPRCVFFPVRTEPELIAIQYST